MVRGRNSSPRSRILRRQCSTAKTRLWPPCPAMPTRMRWCRLWHRRNWPSKPPSPCATRWSKPIRKS
ncbi:UNVERIFIED_CONTAM: hypothetical protein GTU68_032061 [Idotea baltica]|nr:hypothetical protein [Idotea baltica]